ncbi:hypothetical protein [Paenibacillus sp. NFR01]|uniref:hypothetical protein n=1 Tax=Paenibacillus sp. NFR01 TaxID=1566279 RepID=UPI0008BDBCFE|nr:hypothetical protein [Paenibacillus sp. NFR01]SEU26554.1 hypothetical protein SAMN03159358_4516 [Paenibacillus sp. NFR01]
MKTTGNLGLKKPDGTDIVDIADLNGNMDILDTAVKAVQDHTTDAIKHITAAERTTWNAKASTSAATTGAAGLMSAADKAKLDGVAAGANSYVHPTGDGNQHVPATGTANNGKVLKAGSTAGSAAWGAVNALEVVEDTTHRFTTDAEKTSWNAKASTVAATTSAAGLMSATDKAKLDGVATGANNYVHPNHTGDITSTGDGVTAIAPGVIVDADVNSAAAIAWTKISKTGASLADLPTRSATDLTSGTLSAARLPAITGDITMAAGTGTAIITAGSIVNVDINAAAAIDASKIGTGTVSNTEYGYLDGVTSAIQTQLDGKTTLVDYIRQPAYASTAGTAAAYTVTLTPAPASLPDGFGITIVPHAANSASPTLNVNGLGAVPLKDQKGIAYAASKLLAGKPYTFRKVGTDFLADSAGGSGTAAAGDIRAGKTAATDTGDVTGTLAVQTGGTVTPGPSAIVKAAGIYDTAITIPGVTVPAANVLSGTTIAGTAGTMTNRSNTKFQICGYEDITEIIRHPSAPTTQGLVTGKNTYGATGYIDSNSQVQFSVNNLVPENIAYGVNIGKYSGTGNTVMTGSYVGGEQVNYVLFDNTVTAASGLGSAKTNATSNNVVGRAKFSPNGKFLAVAYAGYSYNGYIIEVYRRNYDSFVLVSTLTRTKTHFVDWVHDGLIVFSDNTGELYLASVDIWGTVGTPYLLYSGTEAIYDLCCSPNGGEWIAASFSSYAVRLFHRIADNNFSLALTQSLPTYSTGMAFNESAGDLFVPMGITSNYLYHFKCSSSSYIYYYTAYSLPRSTSCYGISFGHSNNGQFALLSTDGITCGYHDGGSGISYGLYYATTIDYGYSREMGISYRTTVDGALIAYGHRGSSGDRNVLLRRTNSTNSIGKALTLSADGYGASAHISGDGRYIAYGTKSGGTFCYRTNGSWAGAYSMNSDHGIVYHKIEYLKDSYPPTIEVFGSRWQMVRS